MPSHVNSFLNLTSWKNSVYTFSVLLNSPVSPLSESSLALKFPELMLTYKKNSFTFHVFNQAIVVDTLWKITAERKLEVAPLECDFKLKSRKKTYGSVASVASRGKSRPLENIRGESICFT